MRKILVVEDDPDIQEILKNHLTDAGYEVVLAEDGVAGISKFDDTIHLVLLDLMLPKIDGFGVCQVIRQRSQVPIVKDNAVAVLTATALPAYQAGRLFSLRRCHAVKGTVRPAFQRRQVFIGVISHAFPPFCFPLPFLRKGFLPHSCGVFRRWHAPRNFGTFCPEVRLLAVLPQPGYSFSDGHLVFKVLSIDELP